MEGMDVFKILQGILFLTVGDFVCWSYLFIQLPIQSLPNHIPVKVAFWTL